MLMCGFWTFLIDRTGRGTDVIRGTDVMGSLGVLKAEGLRLLSEVLGGTVDVFDEMLCDGILVLACADDEDEIADVEDVKFGIGTCLRAFFNA